jgi:hypothetical protein
MEVAKNEYCESERHDRRKKKPQKPFYMSHVYRLEFAHKRKRLLNPKMTSLAWGEHYLDINVTLGVECEIISI